MSRSVSSLMSDSWDIGGCIQIDENQLWLVILKVHQLEGLSTVVGHAIQVIGLSIDGIADMGVIMGFVRVVYLVINQLGVLVVVHISVHGVCVSRVSSLSIGSSHFMFCLGKIY